MVDNNENYQVLLNWVLGGFSAILAVLNGVIVFLYNRLDSKNTKTIEVLQAQCDFLQKKIDECEKDRLDLHRQMAKLEVKLALLEDEMKEMRKQQ